MKKHKCQYQIEIIQPFSLGKRKPTEINTICKICGRQKRKSKSVQSILNGHNKFVNQINPLLSTALMEMITDCKGKEGEELAGTMNYWWMEIVTLMRKAAAIGYEEGKSEESIRHGTGADKSNPTGGEK